MSTTVHDVIKKRQELQKVLSEYNIGKIVFFKGFLKEEEKNFYIDIETGPLKDKKHPGGFELQDRLSELFCCDVHITVNGKMSEFFRNKLQLINTRKVETVLSVQTTLEELTADNNIFETKMHDYFGNDWVFNSKRQSSGASWNGYIPTLLPCYTRESENGMDSSSEESEDDENAYSSETVSPPSKRFKRG